MRYLMKVSYENNQAITPPLLVPGTKYSGWLEKDA